MGIEPRDLGALEKAVNEAAGRASGLWISFVFFTTLVVITTGTVTHKHLLLELPLKLPVLNVELPLIGYFVAVPLFFVVFHFYVLLQLDGLAAKIEDYNAILREEHPFATDRRLARQRLDSFIFAQVLVGARDRREGRIGALNRTVAWITMVAMPIGTLLLLQLIFLPYHHQGVTWWHRAWVLIDIGLVWFFWGRLAETGNAILSALAAVHRLRRFGIARLAPRRRRAALAVARTPVALSTVVVLFTIFVAAYPTEGVYALRIQPLTTLLLEGAPNEYTGVPSSWLGSNRLVLPNADLCVEEKLVALSKNQEALAATIKGKAAGEAQAPPAKVTLWLRGRDLSYAALERADLRQVDFTGARMRAVGLAQAKLQGAGFHEAQLQDADLSTALLQGALLSGARLQGANLSRAQLQDAYLSGAHLQDANLSGALLQGAHLSGAHLQGADLSGAHLQDAGLIAAELQGADLSGAHLQGALLSGAHLQGAGLTWAQLQVADLSGAELQGADLSGAQLQGALLFRAQLQGADLSGAQLQGAPLRGAPAGREPGPNERLSDRMPGSISFCINSAMFASRRRERGRRS